MNWEPLQTMEIDRIHAGGLGARPEAESGDDALAPPDHEAFRLDSVELADLVLAGEAIPPTEHPEGNTLGPSGRQPATLLPGTTFGRYEVGERLGEGGMGAVFRARDTRLQRDVALKIPRALSAGDRQRFQREATAMAQFRHPNACTIHDCGEVDGIPFIAMEYIEGKNLKQMVGHQPLPAAQAVKYVLAIARALREAHRVGIVHRDLKPENVMIDRDGNPFVMDFGLARRLVDDEPRLTLDGMALGTPQFMSPEQASGEIDQVGPPSDVFSLGSMLYEMLTGTVPFEGNLATILRCIREKTPTRPSQLRPGVDPQLERLCVRMMSRRVEDRPTAEQVAAELTGWTGEHRPAVTGEPRTTAVVPVDLDSAEFDPDQFPTEPIETPAGESFASPTVVTSVLLMLGVAIGVWGPGLLDGAVDQVRGVVGGGDARADSETSRVVRRFEGHTDAVHAMVFSPDGRSLFSAGEDGTVRQWNTATGEPVRTFEHADEPVTSLDVSDDGWRLAAAGRNGQVSFWDVHTGRLLKRFAAHDGPVESLDLSPDASRLVTEGADDRALLHDLAGDRVASRLEGVAGDLLHVRFDSQTGVPHALLRAPDGTLQVWDVAARRLVLALPNGSDAEFSLDGRSVLVADDGDDEMRLYSLENARSKPRTLQGIEGRPRSVSLSPSRDRAAVVSADGHVGVWDLDSGRAVAELPRETKGSTRAVYSPNGLLVLSGDDDVALWKLGKEKPLRKSRPSKREEKTELPDGPTSERLREAAADGTVSDAETEQLLLEAIFETQDRSGGTKGPRSRREPGKRLLNPDRIRELQQQMQELERTLGK